MKRFPGSWSARFSKIALLLLAAALYPTIGFALDNEVWNSGLNFRFYPPGARALGMGGAFVGLADDATAAVSNPAGIAQLTRMQLAIEGRYLATHNTEEIFGYSTRNGVTGRYSNASDVDDSINLSFGAFTTPVFNNMFNISVFYDKVMDFSTEKLAKQRVAGVGRLARYVSSTDISVDEVGLSLAKSFADGRIMVGGGLGVQFLDMDGEIRRYQYPALPTFYNHYNMGESDIELSFRGGILVKPLDNLRLGASVTIMPQFDYKVRAEDLVTSRILRYDSSFDIPDNFAIGAAYNIFPNWAVIFEAKYVRYSQLMKGFAIGTRYGDDKDDIDSIPEDYSMDDVMELHLGTEYVLNAIKDVPIALRAGVFYDPAHDLRYDGPNNIESGSFDGGKDVVHYTVGTGAVFANHFQVDLGADFTEDSENVTLSMVYQF